MKLWNWKNDLTLTKIQLTKFPKLIPNNFTSKVVLSFLADFVPNIVIMFANFPCC